MKRRIIIAILILLGIAAIAIPAWIVTRPPHVPRRIAEKVVQPRRVAPPEVVPEVEPVQLQALTPDDARTFNAGVPFAKGPKPPARPFRFPGGTDDRARAVDCLAAAVYYEAGDDAVGQQAVAQVVLNRLRHPAFPKSVCAVVFQGSERTTGCQFTFTCDGALDRYRPSDIAWQRARDVAGAALSGKVYRPVGLATHYHTDWVVPYWSASLDKIAEVHTHLFFRWTGWWGTPPAFDRQWQAAEPGIAKLAKLSDAHRLGAALAAGDAAVAAAQPYAAGSPLALASEPDTFLVRLDRANPAGFAALAAAACAGKPKCKFMGWAGDAPPAALPMSAEQMAAMSFSFLRDATGFERMLWNCEQYPQATRGDCMKRQVLRAPTTSAIITPGLNVDPPAVPKGPLELEGVRRKESASPARGGGPPAKPLVEGATAR